MVGRNILQSQHATKWQIHAPSRQELDLTDGPAVTQYIDSLKPDLIIHAAGRVGGIQANIANPVEFLTENLSIGQNVIMAAYHANVPKLLNLASTCIYPKDAQSPLDESLILTGPLEPTNEGYAFAKIVALRLCEYVMVQNPKLSYKTLIPCNLYGKYDKFDPKNSHLIPAIIHKVHLAVENNDPNIEIWGTGEARREFMYAGDLADFILIAASTIEDLPATMNVGVGSDYSINEYYKIIADIIGFTGGFEYDLKRPTGMKRKLCSVEKQEEFEWAPPTSLNAGILKTYEYYKSTL